MNFLPLEIDGKRVYAGFWKRFWSMWIDCFVLVAVFLLFAWLQGFNRTLALILIVLSTAFFAFYNIYFNKQWGGTLGKLAVGIRITKPDGEKIGWKEAWLRSLVDLVFALIAIVVQVWALLLVDSREYINLGFVQRTQLLSSHYPVWYPILNVMEQVWIWSAVVVLLLNQRKRALHDFIAGTVVVQKKFVGIMAKRTFTGADFVKIRRSKIKVVLSALVIVLIIVAGVVITGYGAWYAWAVSQKDIPPIDVSDLALERQSVPDETNAYTYFNAATNFLFWPTNSSVVVKILRAQKKDQAFVRELVANNEKAIEVIKKGLNCRICQAPEVTGINDILPPFGTWSNIARVMALREMSERESGQYAQSAQSCTDLLKFGDMIQANPESLIQYLVGLSVLKLGLEQCRQLANDPGVEVTLLIKLSKQIEQLEPFDRGLVRSFKTEYRIWSNLIDDFKEGRLDPYQSVESQKGVVAGKYYKPGTFLFQPNKTKQCLTQHYRIYISNASRPYSELKPFDWSENELSIEGKSKWDLIMSPNLIGKMLGGLLFPNLDVVLKKKCEIECSASATRLILACRVYKKQMNELPETLESLVPQYIDSVPLDPFDGKPFKYSKSKAIVYSVGKDLKDSDGSTELLANGESITGETDRWDTQDGVFQIENDQ